MQRALLVAVSIATIQEPMVSSLKSPSRFRDQTLVPRPFAFPATPRRSSHILVPRMRLCATTAFQTGNLDRLCYGYLGLGHFTHRQISFTNLMYVLWMGSQCFSMTGPFRMLFNVFEDVWARSNNLIWVIVRMQWTTCGWRRDEKSHQNPEKFDLTLPKRNKTRCRQQNGGYSVHMSSVALIIGFWTILFISNALLKVSPV